MTVLLSVPGNYAVDALVALNAETPLCTLDTRSLPVANHECLPRTGDYGLPHSARGETVLIDSAWLTRLRAHAPESALRVLEALRERFEKLVLLDCASPFQIGLPDEWMNFADVILKVNGVYHDLDFYNYIVGAPTPDGCWTQKTQRAPNLVSIHNREKIGVSLPCTIGIVPLVRQKTRRFYCASAGERALRNATDKMLETLPNLEYARATTIAPRGTVHFAGSLTHVQRLDALRKLKSSRLQWQGGITRVPEWITGWRGAQMTKLHSQERDDLRRQLIAENLLIAPQNRVRYNAGMRDCKAVLSITGYGEMCFRMAEAWAAHRVLVCQDVSHAHTLFPLENGRNAVFCRPDLSDLTDILDDIECNYEQYAPIARQGFEDWRQWCEAAPQIVREGFAPLFSPAKSPSLVSA